MAAAAALGHPNSVTHLVVKRGSDCVSREARRVAAQRSAQYVPPGGLRCDAVRPVRRGTARRGAVGYVAHCCAVKRGAAALHAG